MCHYYHMENYKHREELNKKFYIYSGRLKQQYGCLLHDCD